MPGHYLSKHTSHCYFEIDLLQGCESNYCTHGKFPLGHELKRMRYIYSLRSRPYVWDKKLVPSNFR